MWQWKQVLAARHWPGGAPWQERDLKIVTKKICLCPKNGNKNNNTKPKQLGAKVLRLTEASELNSSWEHM